MSFSKYLTWFAVVFNIFMKKHENNLLDYKNVGFAYTTNENYSLSYLQHITPYYPIIERNTLFRYEKNSLGEWANNMFTMKPGTMFYSVNEECLVLVTDENKLINILNV